MNALYLPIFIESMEIFSSETNMIVYSLLLQRWLLNKSCVGDFNIWTLYMIQKVDGKDKYERIDVFFMELFLSYFFLIHKFSRNLD